MTIRDSARCVVAPRMVLDVSPGVRLATEARVSRQTDALRRGVRYGRTVNWFEQQLERLRSLNQRLVDAAVAVVFVVLGLATVFGQTVENGLKEPTAFAVVTTVAVCASIAVRRRAPLGALAAGCVAMAVHILSSFPEGALPIALLWLTYSAAAWSRSRNALVGLGLVNVTIVGLALSDAPGLDALTVLGNLAFFGVAWSIGIAVRARRETIEVQVREADERANVESQRAARVLAEERLLIARELHDVMAHSMSVIAVQAGVGAHVLDEHPDQARAALDAISATSRGALGEMRRLLAVLRDGDGARAHQPAPGLADVQQLVEDVRAAGVPVELAVDGTESATNAAMEASAYRVVQEALTNVIKHAGNPSRVDVRLSHGGGTLTVEVVDDGRGAAAVGVTDKGRPPGSCHGLIGMRERVELWGGRLEAGPVSGGGYRVRATLPDGAPT